MDKKEEQKRQTCGGPSASPPEAVSEPGAVADPPDAQSPPDEDAAIAAAARSTQALPHRTDAGNAELFARLNRNRLRFDHHRQRWLIWRGHWWAEDTDGAVFRIAKAVIRRRRQIALTTGDDLSAELKWAMRSEARTKLDAMLALAKSEGYLAEGGQNWDSDPWLFGVANGVVDLRTGTLQPGRQRDLITMHTGVPFDPAAEAPRWMKFLNETFEGDAQLIDFVQRAFGYSLTGLTTEQCFFCCLGTGSNGKSTLLEMLRHVAGDYGYNMPFSTLELTARSAIPNDVAALVNRRLVTGSETNESAQWNEQRVKVLTGCDSITARFLYKEHFTFTAAAKFWLAFNHAPRVTDDSHGFWRRVRLILFLHKFEGGAQDKHLLNKLRTEAPGVLAWAVRGCLKWLQSGLEPPTAVQSATDAYRNEMDIIGQFLEDRCTISPEATVTVKALYDEFYFWASDNGEQVDRRTFTARLTARGFERRRVGHRRIWTWFGVGLRSEAKPESILTEKKPSSGANGCSMHLTPKRPA